MNVFRRSLFYISRKKGQTVVLFLLFSIVSVFLISSFSILDATDAVAKDLRTSVGGAFYLRPSPKLDFKDGQIAGAEGPPPAISEDVIEEIMSGGNIKYCNALTTVTPEATRSISFPASGTTTEVIWAKWRPCTIHPSPTSSWKASWN